MSTITQQDLADAKDDIKEYIAERVGRVETRLDHLNGSVSRHERVIARHDAEIKVRLIVKKTPTPTDDDKPAITKRDLKVVTTCLGGALVIAQLVMQYFK